MSSRRVLLITGCVLIAIAVQRCGGGPSAPTAPPTATVASVIVTGWVQPLRVGDVVQLSATAIYSDGASRPVTGEATWDTSNASVATVLGGMVTGRGEGTVVISARFSGRSGQQMLTIERGSIPQTGLTCGVERWAVKTLSDPLASTVNLTTVVPTTVRALNQLTTRCSGLPSARTFPEEFITYEVVGRITYVASQDDRDYHVVLADHQDGSYSIVTEVADPACSGAIISPHRSVMGDARISFMALMAGRGPASLVGSVVRVRGVGFFDFNHGQIGRARNCMELHPVTLIERVQ
jgi:hypothetical protein